MYYMYQSILSMVRKIILNMKLIHNALVLCDKSKYIVMSQKCYMELITLKYNVEMNIMFS